MTGEPVQLRAEADRAVLVGNDGSGEREVDPRSLALDGELADALHEWAKVAGAVSRADQSTAAAVVVARRGRQLAARVAESIGVAVGYTDPLTGQVCVVQPPGPAPRRSARAHPPEPVPWLTGLLVSAFVLVLVLFAVLTLASTLSETGVWLAVGSHVVVTAGLLPSVWLARHVPVWRWVALGAAGGIGLGWITLPFLLA